MRLNKNEPFEIEALIQGADYRAQYHSRATGTEYFKNNYKFVAVVVDEST